MPEATAPVLTPTEARQASPRRMNLRVLTWSLAFAAIVGAVLYYGVYAQPGGPISLPKEQPAATAPASDTTTPSAPEATPPAAPPAANP